MLFGTVKVAAVLLSISVMHYAAPPTYRAVRDWSSFEMGVFYGVMIGIDKVVLSA